MAPPTLIIVSGASGAGKTTLAHALAGALGCPAICRDEIKAGMVHSVPAFVPAPDDPCTRRASTTFFSVLEVLIGAGVTLVAEAAFGDAVWQAEIERFRALASIRVLACRVAPELARTRIRARLEASPRARAAHADAALLERPGSSAHAPPFSSTTLSAPTLIVDTTNGYVPGFDELLAFARLG